jgi:hypothetical protein
VYPGYLSLYSVPERPGVIRVGSAPEAPAGLPSPADPRLRYVARFDDLDAARMHLHEALRHGLMDVEVGLYRADLAFAVAAVEADDLRHRRTWIDPRAGPEVLARVDAHVAGFRRRRRRRDRLWRCVGWGAIALLVARVLGAI